VAVHPICHLVSIHPDGDVGSFRDKRFGKPFKIIRHNSSGGLARKNRTCVVVYGLGAIAFEKTVLPLAFIALHFFARNAAKNMPEFRYAPCEMHSNCRTKSPYLPSVSGYLFPWRTYKLPSEVTEKSLAIFGYCFQPDGSCPLQIDARLSGWSLMFLNSTRPQLC